MSYVNKKVYKDLFDSKNSNLICYRRIKLGTALKAKILK